MLWYVTRNTIFCNFCKVKFENEKHSINFNTLSKLWQQKMSIGFKPRKWRIIKIYLLCHFLLFCVCMHLNIYKIEKKMQIDNTCFRVQFDFSNNFLNYVLESLSWITSCYWFLHTTWSPSSVFCCLSKPLKNKTMKFPECFVYLYYFLLW